MKWRGFYLERYLLGQMTMPVLTGVGGGTLLLTVGKLFDLADKLVVEQVPPLDVLKLLLLDLPATMVLAMPIAGMFATMLTLGKLSGNSELTAMRAAGISFWRVFIPVLIMGMVMSTVSFGINNGLVPLSRKAVRDIDQQAILAKTAPEEKQDIFFKTEEGLWFFIREVDPRQNKMKDVTILNVQPPSEGSLSSRLSEVTIASEAQWNEKFWVLSLGVKHTYDPTGITINAKPFKLDSLSVSSDLSTLMLPPIPPDQLSLTDLRSRIDHLSRSNLGTGELQTEWHSRFSLPLATFFAVLISLPLATHTARQVGRYGGVVLGILLVFVYYVILNVSRTLGEAGAITPWIAAWSQNVIFGGVGILLLLRFLR